MGILELRSRESDVRGHNVPKIWAADRKFCEQIEVHMDRMLMHMHQFEDAARWYLARWSEVAGSY